MQRASDPTGAVTRMASIRKIPLVITGGEGGKTSPLTVFSNDSCSATASGVYNVTATNADGNHLELASWDAEQQEDYGLLKPLSHSRRRLDVLQHRLSLFFGGESEVADAGDVPPLPQPVHHPRGEQDTPRLPAYGAAPGHDEEGRRGA
ncbi:hypothetical protein HPB50_020735 [Hyalomma asiaticum]|uniref:Uncharacterized protein n=1 Tax=Hyalomma asiaticum TaxID=266040 RepID=A0ACB7TS40_HYAAI|nr:hypothetical protein HPB50_020735 [Hyalomma asiaticum]